MMSDGSRTSDHDVTVANVEDRLKAEFGVKPAAARLVAERLVTASAPVQDQLRRWLLNGRTPSMEVEGHSIEELVRAGHANNSVSALVLIDDLLRNPRGALRRIRRGSDEYLRRDRDS